jgi:hypothetical protein
MAATFSARCDARLRQTRFREQPLLDRGNSVLIAGMRPVHDVIGEIIFEVVAKGRTSRPSARPPALDY